MAQRPWEILKEQVLAVNEAESLLRKALTENSLAAGRTELKNLEAALAKCESKVSTIFDGNKRGVFKRLRCRGLAQLLPLHINQVKSGVLLFLQNFELTYVRELSGIWICSRKPTLEDEKGFSCDSELNGVILFPFQVEVLCFCPRPGASLVGVVSEIRADGLTAIVLSILVVTIDFDHLLPGSVAVINDEDEQKNVSLENTSMSSDYRGARDQWWETASHQSWEQNQILPLVIS